MKGDLGWPSIRRISSSGNCHCHVWEIPPDTTSRPLAGQQKASAIQGGFPLCIACPFRLSMRFGLCQGIGQIATYAQIVRNKRKLNFKRASDIHQIHLESSKSKILPKLFHVEQFAVPR
jgi:hypothetical protein